jgi:hypothetical protein
MAFKNFLRKNLDASNKGTETQQIDMEGTIAVTQQSMGELTDQLSGARKLKNHQHHPPKNLADTVIAGIETILKIRREIEK